MKYKHGDKIVKDNKWFKSASFLIFYPVFGLACTFLYGINSYRIHNRHKLSKVSKAITVSNHTLFWDPILMCCAAFPHRIYQTLLEQTVQAPVIGTFTRLLGGIPIPLNDTNLNYLQEGCRKVLQKARYLHFYPEGECYLYNDNPKRFHAGAFVISALLDVPVIPMATIFTKTKNRPFIHLYILEPVYPSKFNIIKEDGTIDISSAKLFAEETRKKIYDEIIKHGGTGEFYKGQLKRIKGINNK